ncbi:trans-1,2-dihydrobenzene-1,2-diol dehydrogenase [Drosophila innubila]|uniref:trans-1,2-dihydrobenzene-1,2-diol dehydrogenase n=1 Tax=Drosophila innubila TaxID=198719 RepID=UPI00148BFB02|nr:trans-1,2-dihydrobenzene-1,2-diol dehydrogenase [Drosophila innubila]
MQGQKLNLNWGIAAAGRITQDFVTALGTLESSPHVVIAVADVEGERAQEFAKRNQISRHYNGFDALSQDREVDVVYVGTLNPYHYAVVRLMLSRGKHVLCETPLCLGLAQARELYALAEQRGVFLMEGMWSRFFPSYDRLRELLLNDSIGEVNLIKLQHGFRLANVERITSRALGGSITLDIGIYALQLGQFVFGLPPVKIIPSGTQLNGDRVDVQTEFILDYGANRRLVALVTGLENLENDAIIVGSRGEIKLSNYWCCTQLTRSNTAPEIWPLPNGKFDFNYTNSCGLRYQAEEVRKCIEKRLLESPKYTHAASLELIAITDQIRRQIGVSFEDVVGPEL